MNARNQREGFMANDLQNNAVKEKIDAFMLSRGFPGTTDPSAYSRSFELIFGNDHERQRRLQAILSEKNSSLTLPPDKNALVGGWHFLIYRAKNAGLRILNLFRR
jgi:hypothetical protein